MTTYNGTSGNDTVSLGATNDTAFGGAGNDSLSGGDGNDLLIGGQGNDTLDGGAGNDTLFGGASFSNVIADETFSTAPTGWINSTNGLSITTTSTFSNGNTILGSFTGNGTGAQQISKTFDLTDGAPQASIAFDLVKLDSWDENNGAGISERVVIYIGGKPMFSFTPDGHGTGYGDGANTSGSFAGGTYSVTSSGVDTTLNSNGGDRMYQVQVTLNNPGDTVTLGFGSTLNQSLADESWGIDNVKVVSTDDASLGSTDSLLGGDGDDQIFGGHGNDTLNGGAGNDMLSGGTGADILQGGTGEDTANYAASTAAVSVNLTSGLGAGGDAAGDVLSGVENLTGSAFADSLTGNAADNRLVGGSGNDSINAGAGNDWVTDEFVGNAAFGAADTVNLDDGNDTFVGSGRGMGDLDQIFGGQGHDNITTQQSWDTVYGGDGNDTITTVNEDVQFGDILYGDAGDDRITGANTNDILFGGTGNDVLFGGANTDTVSGDAGNDLLYGGTGADSLSGGADADTIYGGAGDIVVGGEGGNDADTLVLKYADVQSITYGGGTNEAGTVTFTAGSGGGTLSFSEIEAIRYTDVVEGSASGDAMGVGFTDAEGDVIGAGNDVVFGGDGNDTLAGGGGADSLFGGAGVDTASYAASGAGVIVNLANGTGVGGDAAGDRVSGIENITGSAFGDDLTGDGGANLLDGGANHDTLYGGDGADTLYGGDGNDILNSGQGTDTVYGGSGSDAFETETGGGNDTLFGGEDQDGADRDLLIVQNDDSVIITFTGDESGTLVGTNPGSGTTTFHQIEDVWASGGNDTINASASTSTHVLSGYAGDDLIIGGSAGDILDGESDNDTLRGGAGDDRLSGGTGNDTFVLDTASGRDTITDFDLGDNDGNRLTNDRLDVSDLRDADGNPVNIFDVVVNDDGHGNAVLSFPGGESVTLQGVSPGMLATPGALRSLGIPCFVAGTRIMTPVGEVPVERLVAGDLVCTLDNGPQPLIWVGGRDLGTAELAARPELAPVLIRDGALGNAGDLCLSPQHAVILPGGQHLIRAKHLAEFGGSAFRTLSGRRKVSYHHILLRQHQILLANGAACESLYPGAMAMSGLAPQQWAQICAALPALANVVSDPQAIGTIYGHSARPVVGRKWAAKLLSRTKQRVRLDA